MQSLNKSFERIVAGSTATGVVAITTAGSTAGAGSDDEIGNSVEFVIEIVAAQRDEKRGGWSLQLLRPSSDGAKFWIDAEVHWGHSSPLVVVENQEVPGIGQVSARCVIYNHTVAGGWRCGERQGTFHGTLRPRLKTAQHGTYVIERHGEMNRDWWTGSGWSEDPAQAKWYTHEPHAPSESDDEGAHSVYFPTGRVET